MRAISFTFTGSTRVGKLLCGQCAGTVKRLVMELGGHAPCIVYGDTGMDNAVAKALNAKFQTSRNDFLAAN